MGLQKDEIGLQKDEIERQKADIVGRDTEIRRLGVEVEMLKKELDRARVQKESLISDKASLKNALAGAELKLATIDEITAKANAADELQTQLSSKETVIELLQFDLALAKTANERGEQHLKDMSSTAKVQLEAHEKRANEWVSSREHLEQQLQEAREAVRRQIISKMDILEKSTKWKELVEERQRSEVEKVELELANARAECQKSNNQNSKLQIELANAKARLAEQESVHENLKIQLSKTTSSYEAAQSEAERLQSHQRSVHDQLSALNAKIKTAQEKWGQVAQTEEPAVQQQDPKTGQESLEGLLERLSADPRTPFVRQTKRSAEE
jgi:chromosome segregation ATPase